MPVFVSVLLIDLSFIGIFYLFFALYMERFWDIPFFVSILCILHVAGMLLGLLGRNKPLFTGFLIGFIFMLCVSLAFWYFFLQALPELKAGMLV